MRSCEYLKVPGAKDKKTKLLCVRNFRFYLNNKELDHFDPNLAKAEIISITFEDQKNGDKFETVNLQNSSDPILNPVVAWATTITRIVKSPGSTKDTPINSYLIGKKFYSITAKNAINALRIAVSSKDESDLGIKAHEIGTHSIRSGGAMAMYLASPQIPTYTIQLIGRWKSDAFLQYIRRQVKEFSAHISEAMVLNENFSHIPDFATVSPTKIRMVGSPRNKH